MTESKYIKIEIVVQASIDKVWPYWTNAEHIVNWNAANNDWHTTSVEINLEQGGTFCYRMEAKDASIGFDFEGVFDKIILLDRIEYTLSDGRKVKVLFVALDANTTKIEEHFEVDTSQSIELQENGWKAILENFKKYTDSN